MISKASLFQDHPYPGRKTNLMCQDGCYTGTTRDTDPYLQSISTTLSLTGSWQLVFEQAQTLASLYRQKGTTSPRYRVVYVVFPLVLVHISSNPTPTTLHSIPSSNNHPSLHLLALSYIGRTSIYTLLSPLAKPLSQTGLMGRASF